MGVKGRCFGGPNPDQEIRLLGRGMLPLSVKMRECGRLRGTV